METINKILQFAEQVAVEDSLKMKKLDAWEKYIKPLFREHTGYEYNSSYVSMYKKEWKQWLKNKNVEFNKTYSQHQ